MIVGLGDDSASAAPCCSPDERKRKALTHLARAHRSGALAGLAGVDDGQLGSLDPNAWIPDPGDVDAEENSFDARLNAWLVDYQAAAPSLSPALVQQIDDFVQRWRDRGTFWIVSANKARMVIGFEAEFNKFVDQVSAAGHPTSVQPATVTVDGVEHRADQIPPPPPGVFDHIESIVKWAGVVVGGVAAYKLASELGLVRRLGGLIGGGGGGGGGVRRYGSAKRSNPRKPTRRAPWVSKSVWKLLNSAERKMVYTDAEFGDYMSFGLDKARWYLARERNRPGHPVPGRGPRRTAKRS